MCRSYHCSHLICFRFAMELRLCLWVWGCHRESLDSTATVRAPLGWNNERKLTTRIKKQKQTTSYNESMCACVCVYVCVCAYECAKREYVPEFAFFFFTYSREMPLLPFSTQSESSSCRSMCIRRNHSETMTSCKKKKRKKYICISAMIYHISGILRGNIQTYA